jgi:hypothetical protein
MVLKATLAGHSAVRAYQKPIYISLPIYLPLWRVTQLLSTFLHFLYFTTLLLSVTF